MLSTVLGNDDRSELFTIQLLSIVLCRKRSFIPVSTGIKPKPNTQPKMKMQSSVLLSRVFKDII